MDKRGIKRKRVLLTIEDKIKVYKLAKQNVLKSSIMLQYNIRKSTLNEIIGKEEQIVQFKAEKERTICNVKSMNASRSKNI